MASKNPKESNAACRYPDHPIVGVGVVVWREDRVLLVKRRNPPHQGQWSLPGGKQQIGESVMAAAVRETREETGIDINPLGIVTVLDSITADKKGQIEYHYTLVETFAEAGEGDAKAADDVSAVCWATMDEVEKLCEWPEVLRVVRLAALQRVL